MLKYFTGRPGRFGYRLRQLQRTRPKRHPWQRQQRHLGDIVGFEQLNSFNLQMQVGDLVFVDNPVGTGFSYVESLNAYSQNNQQIGADLVAWATDFFTLHSEYATRPFYIFCESYGGKMSAEFASQLQTVLLSHNEFDE